MNVVNTFVGKDIYRHVLSDMDRTKLELNFGVVSLFSKPDALWAETKYFLTAYVSFLSVKFFNKLRYVKDPILVRF